MRDNVDYLKLIQYFNEHGIIYNDVTEDIQDISHIVLGHSLSPIKLHIEIIEENKTLFFSLWITIKSTEFNFEGDRSDCNDIISNIITILVALIEDISLIAIDIEHPAVEIPGEIYGRTIAFIDSRYLNAELTFDDVIENIERIIALFTLAQMMLRTIINVEPYSNSIVFVDDDEYYKEAKTLFSQEEGSPGCNYIERKAEDWKWGYSEKIGISSVNFKNNIGNVLLDFIEEQDIQEIEGVERIFIIKKDKIYAVDKKKINYAKKILKYYKQDKYRIFAIENKFYLISANNIIAIYDSCGEESVNNEKELIRNRRALEDKLLFKSYNLVWNQKINSSRFEDLIRDLLSTENNIKRVRKLGPTNQPDQGCDLLIEYIDVANELIDETTPYRIKKIVGQCKAYDNTVGKTNVQDIRDTIEYHDADGYWLFVSSQLTVPLTNHLQKMRDKNLYHIDWWNRSEIEERLVKYPELINKYPDIVKIDERM